jgi:tellurite resistance protein
MSNRPTNEWFTRLHYGVDFDTPVEEMETYGIAMMAIVAADGLSERERWVATELYRHMGAPAEMLSSIMGMDTSTVDLPELLCRFKDGTPARAMLYDAITIASADGFTDEERRLLERVARLLSVDESVYNAVLSLVEAETALNRLKGSLLSVRG